MRLIVRAATLRVIRQRAKIDFPGDARHLCTKDAGTETREMLGN
jgi:hypothetical protein